MADDSTIRPFPDQPEVVGSGGTGQVHGEFEGYGGDDENAEHSELIARMTRNLADAHAYHVDDWNTTQEDLEFLHGKQWSDEAIKERKAQERPFLTINHLPRYIGVVTGTGRALRVAVKVRRKAGLNGFVTSARGKRYSNAEALAGMVRDIERRSKAWPKYLAALKHSAEGGYGHLYLRKHRPVDDPRNVELRIEFEENRYAVVWDHFAVEFDRSDARWVAIQRLMSRRDYAERYDDDSTEAGMLPNSYSSDSGPQGFAQWWHGSDRDEVRIVEYWYKEPVKDRKMLRMVSPALFDPRMTDPDAAIIDVWEDEIADVKDDLVEDYGYEIIEEDTFDSYHVMGMQATARRMLEPPMRWEGNHLPVVTVPGRIVDINGKRRHVGLIRYAHDSVRMKNYWATAATERVAMAPKDEYIIGASQIEGHEDDWKSGGPPKTARIYDDSDMENKEGPRRESPPQLPTAELSLVKLAQDTEKDTIGLHDANLGRPSNEVSGRAIEERREQGETSTVSEYIDNWTMSIARMGELIVDILPKITAPSKFQRIILDDDSEAEVLLNQRVVDQESGQAFLVAALNLSRYETDVSVGPSFATQRQELVSNILELAKNMPEAAQPILDLVFRGVDFPLADQIAERFKHMIPRAMLSEEDQERIPPPEPTPEQQVEAEKAKADAAKANSTAVQAQSNVEVQRLRVEEQTIRNDQQIQRLEQEKVQLEQEKVQLAQELAKVQREKQQLQNEERQAAADRDVEAEAKAKAAEAIDPDSLP